MVTKSKRQESKGRVDVGKLKLGRETVKDLTKGQARGVKGGLSPQASTVYCNIVLPSQKFK